MQQISVKVTINNDTKELFIPNDQIWSWNVVRRRIIKQFGYPLKTQIQSYMWHSTTLIPLFNRQQNYDFLLKCCLKEEKEIHLVIQLHLTIEFDSDGSIEGADDSNLCAILEYIRPNYGRYIGVEDVLCGYCNKGDKQSVSALGPLYGPYGGMYAHLLCAIWCAEVYVSEKTNRFKNIERSLKKSKDKYCVDCGEAGAGLICFRCLKQMHYGCAIKENCVFDWTKFMLYCVGCCHKHQIAIQQQYK